MGNGNIDAMSASEDSFDKVINLLGFPIFVKAETTLGTLKVAGKLQGLKEEHEHIVFVFPEEQIYLPFGTIFSVTTL